MFVLHFPAHVFDGMDRCLIIQLWSSAERELFHPAAADLVEFAEDRTGQFHCLNLCEGNTETPNEEPYKNAFHLPA